MKTASRIFAALFTIFCLLAIGAVICGKTHHLVMAVASGIMAAVHLYEAFKKEEKIQLNEVE